MTIRMSLKHLPICSRSSATALSRPLVDTRHWIVWPSNPDFDVMVTDIRMPGMSGFELYDLVTARYERVKVVLMSGYFCTAADTAAG